MHPKLVCFSLSHPFFKQNPTRLFNDWQTFLPRIGESVFPFSFDGCDIEMFKKFLSSEGRLNLKNSKLSYSDWFYKVTDECNQVYEISYSAMDTTQPVAVVYLTISQTKKERPVRYYPAKST
jgi:hypothetical protein